jgi:hypothetical protein
MVSRKARFPSWRHALRGAARRESDGAHRAWTGFGATFGFPARNDERTGLHRAGIDSQLTSLPNWIASRYRSYSLQIQLHPGRHRGQPSANGTGHLNGSADMRNLPEANNPSLILKKTLKL